MENLEPLPQKSRFGMTKEERKKIEVDEGIENLAHYLDGLFRIPGTTWRFGLDGIIGLIPNVGDSITSLASFYILVAGVRYGVPKITLLRMAFNIGIDYLVGAIPFVGDAFDFYWKSNRRNVELIRQRATGKDKGTTADYIFVGLIIFGLIGLLIASILVSLYILATFFRELLNLIGF